MERRGAGYAIKNKEFSSILKIGGTSVSTRLECGGRGDRLAKAYCCAIGEAVERYALSIGAGSALSKGRVRDFAGSGPQLDEITFFLDTQYETESFPFRKPEAEDVFEWVPGRDFATGEVSYMPASLVFMPYQRKGAEPALTYQISPGTSCHVSWECAVFHAICELLERDAFTLFWEAGCPGSRISVHQELIALEFKSIEFSDLIHLDITTDIGLPVALTILRWDEGDRHGLTYGMASKPYLKEANLTATREALTSWVSAKMLSMPEGIDQDRLFELLETDPDYKWHMLWSAMGFATCDMDTLVSESTHDDVSRVHKEPPRTLDALRKRIAELGHKIVIFDITPPDVRELGFFVARAVSTTLLRPSLGRFGRHLFNDRLVLAPIAMGRDAKYSTLEDIHEHYRPEP